MFLCFAMKAPIIGATKTSTSVAPSVNFHNMILALSNSVIFWCQPTGCKAWEGHSAFGVVFLVEQRTQNQAYYCHSINLLSVLSARLNEGANSVVLKM